MTDEKTPQDQQDMQEVDTCTSTDLISYAGSINMHGYEILCKGIEDRKTTGGVSKTAILALATPGGDPHAGFRIARALQHTYKQFYVLVPRYCKSAGTLIAIGANALILDDMSELGPLDIQVKKNDEIVGLNSGLDIIAAVDYLREQAMAGFHQYCTELVTGAGLSTKAASDIATRLSIGLIEPIAAQIDPMKLAEMQRAMDIAFQYGRRLNEKSANLKPMGLERLVTRYPSHGFIIDRKEARSIFVNVFPPTDELKQLSATLRAEMNEHISDVIPTIKFSQPTRTHEDDDVSDRSGAEDGSSGGMQGIPELHKDESGAAERANAVNSATDGAGKVPDRKKRSRA